MPSAGKSDLPLKGANKPKEDRGTLGVFSERLREAINEIGGRAEMARQSGVHQRLLSRYSAGETEPGIAAVIKIATAARKPIAWFFGQFELELGANLAPDLVMVPRYDVRASAGLGSLVPAEEISDYLAFKREWFSRMGLNPQNATLVTADGDSMEPTIPNGAMLLLDLSIVEVANGYIYAIRREGELLVKRVQQRFDGTVVLISDNPRYEREEVPPERVNELHVVGRVRWIAHDL